MAKSGDMMREKSEKFQAGSYPFDVHACAHELKLMTTDARLAWLTAATEEQLAELAEYFVDRMRARDWMKRLRSAHLPDLATLFGRFPDAAACFAALERAQITLVFTSHPSELRTPAILALLARIDPESTDEHVAAVLRTCGQRIRTVRPLVTDEIDGMAARAQATIFDGVRNHILRVRAAWEEHFGPPEMLLPLSLRLHTWVGADRDGNPAVTAPTTLQAGARFQTLAKETYARWLGEAQTAIIDAADLRLEIEQMRAVFIESTESASAITERLEALHQRLRHSAEAPAERIVYALLVMYRAVGYHTLSLEWRENSAVIMRADAETSRGEILDSDALSTETRDMLASLCALAQLRRDYGPDAVKALIISNCEGIAVLLALKRLAQACGIFDTAPVAIVPLLESIEALRQAPDLMRQLFAARFFAPAAEIDGPSYCQVMLGYSDAAKDGGRFMADECIRQAQRELAEVCDEFDAVPYTFHGRGGTPARGEATIAESFTELLPYLPPTLLKQTEQGEVIANRYGHPLLAAQTFDQWLFEALDQQLHPAPAENAEFRELLERLAKDAYHAYRLLRDDVNFLAHLMAVTPLLAVCRMPLGSRPAARVQGRTSAPFTLERLRAIPLNLAANVAHLQMPAWYGTGRALAHEIGVNGAHQLRQAYREYAPLRSSLNRACRALALTDFTYAHERADLSGSDQLGTFVTELEAEAERLRAGLLLLGIPVARRTNVDDATLVFRDFQRALFRRTRTGREVSYEVEALTIAAAVSAIGMSG